MKSPGYLALGIFLIFVVSLFVLFAGYADWQLVKQPILLLHLGWSGLVFTCLTILLLAAHHLSTIFYNYLINKKKTKYDQEPGKIDSHRRLFLSKTVKGGIVFLSGGLTGHGWLNAADLPQIIHIPLPIKGLPKDLEGFRIVQLTDLHVDKYSDRGWIEAIVGMANLLKPDLIAVTGDLADAPVNLVYDIVSPLGGLSAPYGSFFVTGNHEYYLAARGVETWISHLRNLGFDVLLNEHRVISRRNGTILVGGVTDHEAGYIIPDHASRPLAAIRNAPETDIKVLLAHQPKSIYGAFEAGFDFQLSGHTHGGQLFPGQIMMALTQPFLKGLHHYRWMQIYVSSGAGCWGPKIRLGSKAEITAITLTAT